MLLYIKTLPHYVTNEHLVWKVGIHLTFVFSGIGFALMDRIGTGAKGH